MARGAAFFDLDRTLMEGSSAFQFGRAAYRAGLLGRRQLLADGWANLRFRLRGATDEDTRALLDRVSESLRGNPRARHRAARPRRADRRAAADLPAAARGRPRAPGRRAAACTSSPRPLRISRRLLATVLALDGAIGSQFSEAVDGVFTGRPSGVFIYGEAKARAIEELARRERIDLTASYAYSDSVSDLPMLARGRQPDRGQPGQAACRDRARGGLGDAALRAAEPAAEGVGRARGRGGRRWRRERGADRQSPPDRALRGDGQPRPSVIRPGS